MTNPREDEIEAAMAGVSRARDIIHRDGDRPNASTMAASKAELDLVMDQLATSLSLTRVSCTAEMSSRRSNAALYNSTAILARTKNGGGFRLGDCVKLVHPKNKFHDKVGTVVGTTPDFVYLVMDPFSMESDWVRKRNDKLKRHNLRLAQIDTN